MKIFCTEAERLEMLTMIAVYNGCLCTPPKRKVLHNIILFSNTILFSEVSREKSLHSDLKTFLTTLYS